MSTHNQYAKKALNFALTQAPIALATLGLVALLLLAFFKSDFAAWIFVAIFNVIGCAGCVFFTVKAHKVYVEANNEEKPSFALGLSIFQTVLALGASAVVLVGTLYPFLYC